jgi:hypothetical protein
VKLAQQFAELFGGVNVAIEAVSTALDQHR